MEKIILIGRNNQFTPTANRFLFLLTGLAMLVSGAVHLYFNVIPPFGSILGGLLLIIGGYYLVYGLLGFSTDSKYAAKIKVNDHDIVLKNSLFKPATVVHWSDVKGLEFKPYELIFKLENSMQHFVYDANPDTSIQIKAALSEFAENKNVEVIEG